MSGARWLCELARQAVILVVVRFAGLTLNGEGLAPVLVCPYVRHERCYRAPLRIAVSSQLCRVVAVWFTPKGADSAGALYGSSYVCLTFELRRAQR